MPTLYTVDRRRLLQPGLTLGLESHASFATTQGLPLADHAEELFPAGVTTHGEGFLLDRRPADANGLIDLLLEYIRRSHYPERPSRYQSVFGSPDLEAARAFRREFGRHDDPIWEIEATEHFDCDMRHLALTGSVLEISYRGHQYWRGKPSDNPMWETLAVPPVEVVAKVPE